jgi:hypothetical protein
MTTASGYLRFWKCLNALLLAPTLFTGPLSASAPTSPRITVQVYNWASVPPQILIAAEDDAARIFRAAGIAVSWLNCPVSIREAEANPICIAPCPASRFAVRIISEMPNNLAKTSLGVALSENGIYATIYYPRVDAYAKEGIATHSQILGHAVAHEMGHLLLGPAPHARFGIMRGKWTAEDLQSIAMGGFLFTPHQSALIQLTARQRMETALQQHSPSRN